MITTEIKRGREEREREREREKRKDLFHSVVVHKLVGYCVCIAITHTGR